MVIFFDIDDTLVDSESAHLKAIEKLWTENNINPLTKQCYQKWLNITDKYLQLYFENKLSLEQQRIYRISEFWQLHGNHISETEAQKLYKRYHYFFLNLCAVFPDTIPTLNKLKRHQLGIITNGSYSDQIFKLKHNNIIHFFDTIIVSEKAGFAKPAKEIFLYAANEAEVPPSTCIYIGDSYEGDYIGSLNAGMKGIWLNRKDSTMDASIVKISSLPEIMEYF